MQKRTVMAIWIALPSLILMLSVTYTSLGTKSGLAYEEAMTLHGRQGSKKVKTGCKTCKYVFSVPSIPHLPAYLSFRVRRVKCDEAKPDCRR